MTSRSANSDNRAALWRQIQQESPDIAAALKATAEVFGRLRGLSYETQETQEHESPKRER